MAYYCGEDIYYRGRKIEVMFRYDSFMSARVVRGKPLHLGHREIRGIKRLLRRQGKAFGPTCDHGCGCPEPG